MDLFLDIDDESEETSDSDSDKFPSLERAFTKSMISMDTNPKLSQFVDDYKQLLDYTFHTREKLIADIEFNQEVQTKIDKSAQELTASYATIAKNADTISDLNEQIKVNHKILDDAHADEQAACELVDSMKVTINRLKLEQQFACNFLEEEDLDDENAATIKTLDENEKERNILTRQVARLNKKLDGAVVYQEGLEAKADSDHIKVQEIGSILDNACVEFAKYKRLKTHFKRQLADVKDEFCEVEEAKVNFTEGIKQSEILMLSLSKKLKKKGKATTDCYTDLASWNKKFCALQADCDRAVEKLRNESNDCVKIEAEMKLGQRVHNTLQQEVDRVMSLKTYASNKADKIIAKTQEIEKSNAKYRDDIENLHLTSEKANLLDCKLKLLKMLKTRDTILNNIARQKLVVQANLGILRQSDQVKERLLREVNNYVALKHKQFATIAFYVREVDRLRDEEDDQAFYYEEIMDNLAFCNKKVFEQKHVLSEQMIKQRDLDNLVQMIETERKGIKRDFKELQSRHAEVKFNYDNSMSMKKKMLYTMQQKEDLYMSNIIVRKALRAETDQLIGRLKPSLKNVKSLRVEIHKRKAREKDLHRIITVIGQNLKKNEELIATCMNERNLLAEQLQLRNQDLLKHYAQIDIMNQMSGYLIGEYKKRVDDIYLMKKEIQRLRYAHSKSVLELGTSHAIDKDEGLNLGRELLVEQMKTSAAEMEIGKVVNIHRWRKLEYSDSSTFKLMARIRLLQRRSVICNKVYKTNQLQLKEVRVMYENLRGMAAKQEGPCLYDNLKNRQDNLKTTENETKSLLMYINSHETTYKNVNLKLNYVGRQLALVRQEIMKQRKQRYTVKKKMNALKGKK